MNKTLSGCVPELENKGKVEFVNPKSGCSCLQERSLTRVIARRASNVVGVHLIKAD